MIGETTEFLFGENGFAISFHFENPAASFNEFNIDGWKVVFNICLQTGGFGIVVSDHAIFNCDVHCFSFCNFD